jgi:hypothetical protein
MQMIDISSTTLVDDILHLFPCTSRFFLDLHSDCIGCQMARFCSLEDVAMHYQLGLETLLTRLQAYASDS